MTLNILGYLADVFLLGTYATIKKHPRWYDWANFLCFPVLLIIETTAGAYPVIPLTATFGVLGGWHLLQRKSLRTPSEKMILDQRKEPHD